MATEWSKRPRLNGVSGNMELMFLLPPSLEPNALQRNKLGTVDMLRDYVMTGRPPSPGKWVTQPTVTVTDNGDGTGTIAVTAGQADWDGIILDYEAASYTKPLPSEGLLRFAAVAATDLGDYAYYEEADSQNPLTPAIPFGYLLANYVLLNNDGGEVMEPNPTGITWEQLQSELGDYLHKNSTAYQSVAVGPGIEFSDTGTHGEETLTGFTQWLNGLFHYGFTAMEGTTERANFLIDYKPQTGTRTAILGIPSPVAGEDWSWQYEQMHLGPEVDPAGSRVFAGPFLAGAVPGYLVATYQNEEWQTLEFSGGKLYLNGVPFTGNPSEPGTGYSQATLEGASSVLNFLNPLGHIRTEALTGAQTFSKTGATLGTTVVQAYTSTGTGALTFDFAHTILNSEFASGQVLATGDYKLFFSNWGDSVAVNIATVGAGTAPEEPTPNQAPTANAGSDQSITLPTNSVTLNGAGTDTDGTIASYAWTKVSGGAATIATPNAASTAVTGLEEGLYVFRLTVTDNQGATAFADTHVTVLPQGTPPDTTPPSAPTNLTFTNVTQTSATANWQASESADVAGYNLYLNDVKQN